MLTKHRIVELVDAARDQGIADDMIPSTVGWADRLIETTDTTGLDAPALVSAWMTRLQSKQCGIDLVRANRTGVVLLAYAVGTDLAWQLADDVQDNGNPLALSALLDLVADACYA
jgi:hypothetical protein